MARSASGPSLLLLLFVGGLVLVPTGYLALAAQQAASGDALANYEGIIGDGYVLRSLGYTVIFCVVTASIATMLAVPAALWIALRRPGYQLLRSLCQANFAFNGVVYGILIVTLLGNTGLVPLLERSLLGTELSRGYVYTTPGLALAYFGFQIPRAAVLFSQALERLDLGLFGAARLLGASWWQRLLWVGIPQLRRPATVVFLAISMMSLASFGTALLVARTIEIFPVLIYQEFTAYGDFGRAAAMGMMLAACCLVLEMFARKFAGQTESHGRNGDKHVR